MPPRTPCKVLLRPPPSRRLPARRNALPLLDVQHYTVSLDRGLGAEAAARGVSREFAECREQANAALRNIARLLAACRAHGVTVVHALPVDTGPRLLDLNRVIIGHCDENAYPRQFGRLMERGAYLQFDVLGKQHWLPDETRADLMAALVARGYSERLLLSTDRNRIPGPHVGGGPGYDHVLACFLPMLRAHGMADAQIRTILVTNPARVFAMPATPPSRPARHG